MRLEATGISGGYGQRIVLHDVSVAVEGGEFVGLIGQNGSGKSTLLKILTGVLPATAGSVSVGGIALGRLSALDIARRVAFVPQSEPAVFEFRVRDIVLMGRYPRRVPGRGETPADFAAVEAAMADADILELADRSITRLSGGEHRRVLLARALAQDAPLLLLDEPTAHLDVTHQAALMMLVRRWTRERGVGAIAALHDLGQAAEFCDRLLLMHDGRIVAAGRPEAVVTRANLRAAYAADAWVASNPMSGRPQILSLRPAQETTPRAASHRIHVVCGGGTGGAALGVLVSRGYSVTAGVLNRLDSDEQLATALGIEMVLVPPFTAIDECAKVACARHMSAADTILVTAVPFSAGNLANLEMVRDAQQAGVEVVLVAAAHQAGPRDFTGGVASRILAQLASNGAVLIESIESWAGPAARPPDTTALLSPVHPEGDR
jgi:iron complex transport system ATP-binding protein